MNELISIIVPVYNVENSLRKCVESIISQTYKNLQIILIDDGSMDLSSIICDDMAKLDNRIEVVHKVNGGLCAARNTGLELAKGEYIGFIDSDDWITPDMFEYLLKGIKDYDADISACRYFRFQPGKKTQVRTDGEVHLFTAEEAIEETIVNFDLRTVFWNKLFKKEIFDKVKFPEGHTFEGTYMMHEVLEQAEKIVFLPEAKYYYVKNPDSIIYNPDISTDVQYALSNVKRYNDLIDRFPKLISKLMGDVCKNVSKISAKCRNINEEKIKKNRAELEIISEFIKKNIDTMCLYYGNNKHKRKEYLALSELTVSSMKKAYKHCRKYNRSVKNSTAFRNALKLYFGIKLKKTSANMLPPIASTINSASYIYGVTFDENSEQGKKLKSLHNCEIEIMKEIDRLCKENQITYYLYGGTLLGAVRHKGFIPWDDDVDLVMPRADYEKFAKVCSEQLDSRFTYQTCFTDSEFPMLFAKLRMNNTRVSENKWSNKEMHQGCFVDILPLDHFPSNPLRAKFTLRVARILHQACCFNSCHSSHLIAHIAFRMIKRRGSKYAYNLRDRFLKYTNRHGSSKYYCSFGSHYLPMIRRRLDADWFGKPKYMEFENMMLPVPEKWECYLIHLFGNSYMELPPVEGRICHTNFNQIITDPEVYKQWEIYRQKAVEGKKAAAKAED